jgi:hypothetical protein
MPKPRRTKRHRGRKSTNALLELQIGNFSSQLKSVELDTGALQKLRVRKTAANPSGTFDVKLQGTDAPEQINFDERPRALERKLERLQSVGAGNVEVFGTRPIDREAAVIHFRVNGAIPALTVSNNVLVNAALDPISIGHVRSWKKANGNDNPDQWVDATSKRGIMVARHMSIATDANGRWLFVYQGQVLASRHKWVHKLEAFSADDRKLFRLAMRPVVHRHKHFLDVDNTYVFSGRSQVLRDVVPEIAYWARWGVGEYWD